MLDDNPYRISALPQLSKNERFSKKNFAEYKLYPSLISLSLRPKFHPSFLQQTLVRPSKLHLINRPPEFG